jgi:hypothetical protein
MNMNIVAPETRALQMGARKLNRDFLERGSDDFD